MLELKLFGRFEALVDGAPLRRLRTHRGQTVLAYLALHAGKPVDRASLAAIVWPLSDPSDALYSLRRTLTDLRQALGTYSSALVSPTAATLMLDANRAFVDVEQFRSLTDDADVVCRAADFYRGELLEGWNDEWLVSHRSNFSMKLRECLLGAAKKYDLAGNPRQSAEALQSLLLHEPHNEDLLRMTIQRTAKAGEPATAWALYESFKKRLEHDLGFAVSDETLRVAESIRVKANTPAASEAGPVRGFIESSENALIGRDDNVTELEGLLAGRRLVTLIGLGGIGKTRLAVEVARLIERRFANGAWLIPLASVREPREAPLVVSAMLRPLDPEPQGPAGELMQRLRDADALILLDNCEHVVDAVRDICRAFQAHCPNIRILATSQSPIGLEHERLYAVPVLGVSAVGESAADSVTLFRERALAANPHVQFTDDANRAIERICRRLEGIPLAIELAASRVRYVEPAQLDELLGERLEILSTPLASRDPRHSTLDATLAWSFDHLKDSEQEALMGAATFVGTWSVDDLTKILDAASTLNTVRVLESLVERSLVVEAGAGGRPRFRLLDPVRQFAGHRALEVGMQEVFFRRHTDMVLDICQKYSDSFATGKPSPWHSVLEESDNEISAAFHRGVQAGRTLDVLRITATTWRFIWNRGLMQLGRDRAERTLQMPEAASFGLPYWDSLHVAGLFAWSQAEFNLAADRLSAALEGYRTLDNDEGLGRATTNLGQVLRNQGRTYESEALSRQAKELWERLGNPLGVALAIGHLGISAFEQCRYEDSLALFHESRRLCVELNAKSPISGIDLNEGQTLHELGRYEEAEQAFARARKGATEMSIVIFEIMADHYRGFMQLTRGEYLPAARAFQSGIESFIRIGEIRGIMLSIEALGLVAAQAGFAREAGLLIGAADMMRAHSEVVRTPVDLVRFDRHTSNVLGTDFDEARVEGRSLSRSQVLQVGAELIERL